MSVAPRASAADLASSAFQTTTPRMQAVMTSAKKITTIAGRDPPEEAALVCEVSIGHLPP